MSGHATDNDLQYIYITHATTRPKCMYYSLILIGTVHNNIWHMYTYISRDTIGHTFVYINHVNTSANAIYYSC